MSWSVSASGNVSEVRGSLNEQFKGPLAEKPAGLSDDGERRTVEMLRDSIEQCLSTFDPANAVTVSAYGHMGFSDWTTKAGAHQSVSVTISLVS